MKKRLRAAKTITYTSIWLEKGKVTFKLKCMVLKKPKAHSQCWNIKNSNLQSQKWDVMFKKWSNVMICAEAKWKASKICNYFLVGGHIYSFL